MEVGGGVFLKIGKIGAVTFLFLDLLVVLPLSSYCGGRGERRVLGICG